MANREIKFRAWDKKNKSMLFKGFCIAPTTPDWSGFPIENSEKVDKYIQSLDREHGDLLGGDYSFFDWSNYHGIMNYDLMQFTGLKDKLGKEIYEGDIVKCTDHPTGESDCLNKVVFTDGSFWVSGITQMTLGDYGTAWTEVIGNIYENPELLKHE